jgi:hypothetical protein
VRHPHPQVGHGRQTADRELVGRREDRRRRRRVGEVRAQRAVGTERGQVVADECRSGEGRVAAACGSERGPETALAVRERLAAPVAGDVEERAVSEAKEVLGGEAAAGDVVGCDAAAPMGLG